MMHPESLNRPIPTLREVHGQLREIYDREYPQGSPHLYELLLPKLPHYIRALVERKMRLIIEEDTGLPQTLDELSPEDRMALSMFLDPQALRAHLDVGRDAVLSNDGHVIAHFETQLPIVAHQLISAAAQNTPERLERSGSIFLDVDGTKTIVDCTSHATAGKYLEHLAEFLCQPPARIRDWLSARKLRSEANSVAGDEFLIILSSEEAPVTKELLDEFGRELQRAIAESAELASYVSFDDPGFVMEYDDWNDEDRAAWESDPVSMQQKFTAARSKLPDAFTPSVSSGSATFMEGLDEALSPDTEEANTLQDLANNAFRLMVARADARLKEDKRVFRSSIEDPRWRAFLARNNENRRLLDENQELRRRVEEVLNGSNRHDQFEIRNLIIWKRLTNFKLQIQNWFGG